MKKRFGDDGGKQQEDHDEEHQQSDPCRACGDLLENLKAHVLEHHAESNVAIQKATSKLGSKLITAEEQTTMMLLLVKSLSSSIVPLF